MNSDPPINTDLVNVIVSREVARDLLAALETGMLPSRLTTIALEQALVKALSPQLAS